MNRERAFLRVSLGSFFVSVHSIEPVSGATGPFFAVAGAYEDWYDLTQEQVLDMLREQDEKKLFSFN